jgi:proteasome lid subunit RPN8/RPN11
MLVLSSSLLKALIDRAEAEYPIEACALLIGRRRLSDHFLLTRVELSKNVAAEPKRRFEIDPGLRIGIERELRGKEEAVIGVWHSHPDAGPEPSAWDREMIFEPDLVWVITAVSQGQAVDTRAYLPRVSRTGASGFFPLSLAFAD